MGMSQFPWVNRGDWSRRTAAQEERSGSAGALRGLALHCLFMMDWALGVLEPISSPMYLLHFFA